jgi:hypothetical protein
MHRPMEMLSQFTGFCRRRSPRYSVLLTARVLTTAGSLQVTVRDLSLDGAMIQAPVDLPLNTSLLLHRGTLIVPATVMWREGRRVGLRFERKLSKQELYREVDRARCRPDEPLEACAA